MKSKILFLLLTISLFIQCTTSSNEKEMSKQENKKDSCCVKPQETASENIEMQSEITCPECGHKKMETMPTDVCRIRYNCEKCNYEMTPKDGDCCVFCTYGTHKCPSMQ